MSSVKRFALPLAGLGVLAFAVLPVYAHCGKCAGDCKEVLKQMDTAKATAASMVAAAETASKGKAVGMYCQLEKGKMDCDVFAAVGDKVQDVEIDAAGKAGKMEEAKDMKGMGDVVKSMDASKLTMAKVIEAGEAKSTGKALTVTAKAAGGKASYEVYCLAGDKLQNVKVDDTGKATGMEEAKMLPAVHEEKPKPKPGG
jgi:uncharacterized membrane protein YkoI